MTNREYTGTGDVVNSGGLTQEELYQIKDRVSQLELLMPPVGSIISWAKVSFGNNDNGSPLRDTSVNTINKLDDWLVANTDGKWRVCDGRLISDPDSWWDGRRVPNITDERFISGRPSGTSNLGTVGGSNSLTTSISISGGVSNARACFNTNCNRVMCVTNSKVTWSSSCVNYCHRHSHNHNHFVLSLSCPGRINTNMNGDNLDEFGDGSNVGANGGCGVNQRTNFTRDPPRSIFTGGLVNCFNHPRKMWTDTTTISIDRCRWNAGQNNHNHNFQVCCLNLTCLQNVHNHGHNISAAAAAWNNRPQWFGTYFIIRVK